MAEAWRAHKPAWYPFEWHPIDAVHKQDGAQQPTKQAHAPRQLIDIKSAGQHI